MYLIQEYDDALTARIIERITVRSRNEILIRFIGGYEKVMPLRIRNLEGNALRNYRSRKIKNLE